MNGLSAIRRHYVVHIGGALFLGGIVGRTHCDEEQKRTAIHIVGKPIEEKSGLSIQPMGIVNVNNEGVKLADRFDERFQCFQPVIAQYLRFQLLRQWILPRQAH